MSRIGFLSAIGALALLLLGAPSSAADGDSLPKVATLRHWIDEMKASGKGPFARIRWFCRDGSVLAPDPYACAERGGGVQHGEWSERTKLLRANGYFLGNVLIAIDPGALRASPDPMLEYGQVLLERFLMDVDHGWILRRAGSYRGALQDEDERAGAARLLHGLANDPNWAERRFLPLRLGVALLPRGDTAAIGAVRARSADLAARDPDFEYLRNKLHGHLTADDAQRVRHYAAKLEDGGLAAQYRSLAESIDAVFRRPGLGALITATMQNLASSASLLDALEAARDATAEGMDDTQRFAAMAALMAQLRDQFGALPSAAARLRALDLSLTLEAELSIQGGTLLEGLSQASRAQRLAWLKSAMAAVYGSGLISRRELAALQDCCTSLSQPAVSLTTYKDDVDYLGRVPEWGARQLYLCFAPALEKLAALDPLAQKFISDRLSASPVSFYSKVIDSLASDAGRLSGLRQDVFGQARGGQLRPFSPGLARGVLHVAHGGQKASEFAADGIYVLPETPVALPPVAGIIANVTASPLAPNQLLARDLGIPEIGVDPDLLARIAAHDGKAVVLAVSTRGAVQLIEDAPVASEQPAPLHPDLSKLDLKSCEPIPLSKLRATDAGRVVGPEAAKLGELFHHYPEYVAKGLAIPFCMFRKLLDRPLPGTEKSAWQWMVDQYAAIAALPQGSAQRAEAAETLRAHLHDWIGGADPGDEFRKTLATKMRETFGQDGSYGVALHGETNVDGLPGTTGAQLKVTLPNVVGIDQVMAAIPQVWASPFSEQAYAWRQARMQKPQHVYPAVLLLRSVPVEKSGVLVTRDVDTGADGVASVLANEGIGGAVAGRQAESLRINLQTEQVRLLGQATAPYRSVLAAAGGLRLAPASGRDAVLLQEEIQRLVAFTGQLPERFPPIVDAAGVAAPAEVEFGFLGGRLKLFNLRPYLENPEARSREYLSVLDRRAQGDMNQPVAMDTVPAP